MQDMPNKGHLQKKEEKVRHMPRYKLSMVKYPREARPFIKSRFEYHSKHKARHRGREQIIAMVLSEARQAGYKIPKK